MFWGNFYVSFSQLIKVSSNFTKKGTFLFFWYLQGYEDWLRHNSDNEVNGAPVYVVRSGGLVKTRSKNIRVCI